VYNVFTVIHLRKLYIMKVAQMNDFMNAVYAKFPDVKANGIVTRKQLLQVMEETNTTKWPALMLGQSVGRGMYAIKGGLADHEPEIQNEPKVAMDVTNRESLIPAVDSCFVPFGNYNDVQQIIKTDLFYPIYITGPTGNGKSTMVEQICAKNKKPMIRVNLNAMSDEDQLIGSKTLEDGNVKIVYGPVILAMKLGCPLLLDEIDAGSSNSLLCLQPILEGKPYYFKLNNEIIHPAKGFNIIATANTKGKGSDDGRYIGTNLLNEAFLERFAVTFEQEYPSSNTELKIISKLMEQYGCVDEPFAELLVKWADAIRRTFEDGGVDENITTRRMIHVIKAYSIFKNRNKAIELCCNRFDRATKTAFIDLFEKISDPTEQPLETNMIHDPSTLEKGDIPF